LASQSTEKVPYHNHHFRIIIMAENPLATMQKYKKHTPFPTGYGVLHRYLNSQHLYNELPDWMVIRQPIFLILPSMYSSGKYSISILLCLFMITGEIENPKFQSGWLILREWDCSRKNTHYINVNNFMIRSKVFWFLIKINII